MSNSGIGIIRISGDEAITVADRVFKSANKDKLLKEQKTYTVHYGYIYDGDDIIDEVLAVIMRGPHSFTAEDTVEIDCHGGVMVMKKILEVILKNGARPAEPGEFSKRAFLNGRIDLSQAEAVMDLISAESDYALKSSVKQLRGSVSAKIKDIRDKIIYEIAFIESALDDPEHISLEGYPQKLKNTIIPILEDMKKQVESFDDGRILREGIKTVILGKPNAGKSSLLNMLLGVDRAIVTDIEGTTRDTLEENVRLKGINLKLIDTAGIRETEDIVEKIGVDKARSAADEADLIIYVADASRELDDSDMEIIELTKNKCSIIILNKTDLDIKVSEEKLREISGQEVIPFSVKEEKGLDILEEKVKNYFYEGKVKENDEEMITNLRHKDACQRAIESLEMVLQSIEDDMPEDFFSIDLMNAYESLGTIIGETLEEDLVNEIFSKFCMGK